MTASIDVTTGPVLDGDELLGYRPSQQAVVSADRVAAFAAAIGETDPARLAGVVAPPTFAFVPFTDLLFATFQQLVGDDTRGRLVHTHQRFTMRRALRAGDRLQVSGRVERLQDGPFGAVLEVGGCLLDADGHAVAEQAARLLVPGARTVNPVGSPTVPTEPEAGRGRRGGAVEVDVAGDLPARYAEASGDRNPIHLDPAVARSVGFPGVLVHGMATLALVVHALETVLPARGEVVGLAVEWTRPVFPGDRLTVRYDERSAGHGAAEGAADVAFEVVNRRRRTVMRGGLISFAGRANAG